VQDKPGMPERLRALPADGAGLLVETRAATAAALAVKIDAIVAELAGFALATPLRFATDAAEAAALWNVRKGCSRRSARCARPGTTVIIEDVAFRSSASPKRRWTCSAAAGHGYPEAIIFGHALEGNLHFVFTQDFGNAAEVERYRRLHGRDVRDGRRASTTAR
jgi:D-lactate dehydrogenase